jgi:hypothetical protein
MFNLSYQLGLLQKTGDERCLHIGRRHRVYTDILLSPFDCKCSGQVKIGRFIAATTLMQRVFCVTFCSQAESRHSVNAVQL